MTKSILDDIPGLGPVRKARLVKELGGVNAVRAAPIEELLSRSWLPDEVGLAVYEATHNPGGQRGARVGTAGARSAGARSAGARSAGARSAGTGTSGAGPGRREAGER